MESGGRGGGEPPRLRMVGADVYESWEGIYRDNVGWVYQRLFSKVGSRPDAEDLTTEVFLAALRPLRVSATVGEVRAYLAAAARTVLASHWRRTLGRELTTLDLDEGWIEPVAPELTAAAPDRVAEADRILAALPANYGMILQLRFLDGLTLKEAAARMAVTVSNAKVLQHRALKAAARIAERSEA